jgi:SecD/SecF fusion protein
MLLYYMIAGALADVALVLNLLIIIGVMAFSRATFTMPGIAGLILTIGMAVDANVLVYERIREEQQRGSSLRIAIKNGYDRAFRTIFDANLTTILVALILWIFASEEIKGFALTLIIGLISNMFTALFVTRMIFDFLIDVKILRNKLKMMQLISNDLKIKWMSLRPLFWLGSLVLVVGSWVVYMGRDEATNSKYSIEFTGGTDIHVVLTKDGAAAMLSEQEKAAGVALREKIEEAICQEGERIGNALLAKSRVQQVGPTDKYEYSIVTTETNQLKVKLSLTGESKPGLAEVENLIRQAGRESGDRHLGETKVTALETAGQYLLVTRQTDINKVSQLIGRAIAESELSNPVVDAVVGDAVRNALKGKLDLIDNLIPNDIKSEPITDELISRKPYLGDYAGGIFLSCQFGQGKSETLERLKKRFVDGRFRSELEKYTYNEPHLFVPGNADVGIEERLTGIEVAVMSPDIIYGGSSEEEWRDFEANEQGRLRDTLSLETSFARLTQIDPSVGQESKMAAIIAVVFSMLAIMGYIWLRFGNVRFSAAAVVSLIHDVSIALGMVAASAWLSTTAIGKMLLISDFKIDLPVIAGLLTIIGYSLNDTIVIFDRIRENRGKMATLSSGIVNASVNQTLSRTIITSLTTVIVLAVMYIWGGPGLRGFNYVLIIGIVVGTYSSVGIAAPLLFGAQFESAKTVSRQQEK